MVLIADVKNKIKQSLKLIQRTRLLAIMIMRSNVLMMFDF